MCFKGDSCRGGKRSKELLTGMVCTNMDGSEKLQQLAIGTKTLPVTYAFSKKVWTTSVIFEDWLGKLDKRFKVQRRNMLMSMYNCPSHPRIVNMEAVKLVFLQCRDCSCVTWGWSRISGLSAVGSWRRNWSTALRQRQRAISTSWTQCICDRFGEMLLHRCWQTAFKKQGLWSGSVRAAATLMIQVLPRRMTTTTSHWHACFRQAA